MLLSTCCAVNDSPEVWTWKRKCCDLALLAWNLSFIILAYTLRAALNLAISSKNSMVQQKKKDSLGAKSSTLRPLAVHVSTYSMASANVNASSCTALEPASRMWYPEMLTGYHWGTFFEQYSIMSPIRRIEGLGG